MGCKQSPSFDQLSLERDKLKNSRKIKKKKQIQIVLPWETTILILDDKNVSKTNSQALVGEGIVDFFALCNLVNPRNNLSFCSAQRSCSFADVGRTLYLLRVTARLRSCCATVLHTLKCHDVTIFYVGATEQDLVAHWWRSKLRAALIYNI